MGPESAELRRIARKAGVWLLPGTVPERGEDGGLYNTAVVIAPDGKVAASYRKIFPWRPFESSKPGDRFVVFDMPGVGHIGLAICYDIWYPEVSRQLAWMGAEVIIFPAQTSTCDRAQELVLARANAIVNQVFVVSVNAAAPVGTGQSIVVDPEGLVRTQAPSEARAILTDVIDLDEVSACAPTGRVGSTDSGRSFARMTQCSNCPSTAARSTRRRGSQRVERQRMIETWHARRNLCPSLSTGQETPRPSISRRFARAAAPPRPPLANDQHGALGLPQDPSRHTPTQERHYRRQGPRAHYDETHVASLCLSQDARGYLIRRGRPDFAACGHARVTQTAHHVTHQRQSFVSALRHRRARLALCHLADVQDFDLCVGQRREYACRGCRSLGARGIVNRKEDVPTAAGQGALRSGAGE